MRNVFAPAYQQRVTAYRVEVTAVQMKERDRSAEFRTLDVVKCLMPCDSAGEADREVSASQQVLADPTVFSPEATADRPSITLELIAACDGAQLQLEQRSCDFGAAVENVRNVFAPAWQQTVTAYQVEVTAVQMKERDRLAELCLEGVRGSFMRYGIVATKGHGVPG